MIIHKIAPIAFFCNAIYPAIDPMIVGIKIQKTESPTPERGPINEVLSD